MLFKFMQFIKDFDKLNSHDSLKNATHFISGQKWPKNNHPLFKNVQFNTLTYSASLSAGHLEKYVLCIQSNLS